jgi:hypothetical protein
VKCAAFIAAFVLLSSSAGSAESPWGTGVRIVLEESATPIIPSQAEVRVSLPGAVFFREGVASRLGLEAWYLAGSPLLLPEPFFEAGVLADIILLERNSSRLQVGLGSAFSMLLGEVSVPLIVRAAGAYYPFRWLAAEAAVSSLLYGEGLMIDGSLEATAHPFRFGLLVSLGAGASIGYSWATQQSGRSWRLTFGLGWLVRGRPT